MVEYKINTTKKDVIWNYIGTIVLFQVILS